MAHVSCNIVEKDVENLLMCCVKLVRVYVPLAPVILSGGDFINSLRVNYLFQICAFYEWIERNPLSANAIALWHALMYLWNHSFWKETFTPAVTSIIPRCNLSKSSILRAREELVENGLLTVKPRKKKQTSIYELHLFEPYYDTHYKLNEINLKENEIYNTTCARNADDATIDYSEVVRRLEEKLKCST